MPTRYRHCARLALLSLPPSDIFERAGIRPGGAFQSFLPRLTASPHRQWLAFCTGNACALALPAGRRCPAEAESLRRATTGTALCRPPESRRTRSLATHSAIDPGHRCAITVLVSHHTPASFVVTVSGQRDIQTTCR
ncbi:unnamed protein product [Parajaminaea phylloscopi]